jgi:response regulator RpfG family c-di-GMP phosphodiesterase
MPRARILSVGQCGFDHANLSYFAKKSLDADLVAADTSAQALARLNNERFDLVLVNRVGDRDGQPGLDLICALKANPKLSTIPTMLVSNFQDAQAEAIAAGALLGFGKADVGRPDIVARVLSVIRSEGVPSDRPTG